MFPCNDRGALGPLMIDTFPIRNGASRNLHLCANKWRRRHNEGFPLAEDIL